MHTGAQISTQGPTLRYIVGYTFGNHVLRLRSHVAVKLNFRPYIRRYTSPNENFEHSYPLIHCLLLFPLCCGVFVLCDVVLNVLSSLAIHCTGGERAGCFVSMCSCCRVTVWALCLFLAVPWVGLQSVIETFPGHTHLLFNRIHVIFTFHIQW